MTYLVANRGLDNPGLMFVSLQFFLIPPRFQPALEMGMASCMTAEAQTPEITGVIRTAPGLLYNVVYIVTISTTIPTSIMVSLENKFPEQRP